MLNLFAYYFSHTGKTSIQGYAPIAPMSNYHYFYFSMLVFLRTSFQSKKNNYRFATLSKPLTYFAWNHSKQITAYPQSQFFSSITSRWGLYHAHYLVELPVILLNSEFCSLFFSIPPAINLTSLFCRIILSLNCFCEFSLSVPLILTPYFF